MMVMDCSAALEIAQGSDRGRAFAALMAEEGKIVTPSLYPIEVANAAWKYVHVGHLSEQQARELIEFALALPDEIAPAEDLLKEAFVQGVRADHSIYDMVYMVLARRHGATMFTNDRKLQELCLASGVDVVFEMEL